MASAWLPAMLGVLVIVIESTDYFSSAHTSGPLRHLWTMLFGPPASNMAWERIHTYIRKTGHVLGYGILNALFFRAWYISLRIINEKMTQPWLISTFLALLSTFAIGSFDELHQKLLPSRTSSPLDVAIDMAGALTVQLIISVFYVNRGRQRQQEPVASRS
jgi:VanZ family protein